VWILTGVHSGILADKSQDLVEYLHDDIFARHVDGVCGEEIAQH
jgi:hypothetical protein